MHDTGTPILTLVAILAWPLASRAQVPVWELPGSAAGDAFGAALATIDDVDADLVRDLLVSAPRSDFAGPNAGSVYLLSGATGALIQRTDGAMNGEIFGGSIAAMADLNGDGITDWIAGAPFASVGAVKNGRAEVRSGADGALLLSIVGIEQFGLAGTSVAGTGDANGDGVPDVVVCAPYEDSNGTDAGSVNVHSGVSGALIRTHTGDFGGDRLGICVIGLPDVTGDGIDDYAAGTPHGNNGFGLLRVYSGQNGNVVYTRLGTVLDAGFASAACALGDLTGDGRPEIAIGEPGSGVGGQDSGTVTVINGSTGALIRLHHGQPGELLGTSLADAGDWNGDGTLDILAGAPDAGSLGAAYVYSGVDGTLLVTVNGTGTNQTFGDAVVGGFDIDGDGNSEVAVGDKLADGTGTDSGLLRVFADHSLLGIPYCFGDGTGASCPCGNLSAGQVGCANSGGSGALLEASGSASVLADDLELHGSDLLPGQAGLAFAGSETQNGGLGFLFGDGLRCAGGMVQRLSVRIPDGAGSATWGPELGSTGGWVSGDTRFFQIWYRDTSGGPCSSGFNLSNALELTLLP